MFHQLTTHLIIVTLLTCPLACLTGSACCVDGEVEITACCGACAQTSTPADSEPLSDNDSCQSWCLCKGAIPDKPLPDLKWAMDCVVQAPTTTVAVMELSSTTAMPRNPEPDSHAYGEGLRIALRSFLC